MELSSVESGNSISLSDESRWLWFRMTIEPPIVVNELVIPVFQFGENHRRFSFLFFSLFQSIGSSKPKEFGEVFS